MQTEHPFDRKRQRAPSKRALATRERVLDAAERIFAARGFDGATIRDIAAEAGEPVGSVHHHGGGKELLFHQAVARRSVELSQARRDALEAARASGPLTLERVLDAFMRPFFALAEDEPRWSDYARLVALVSADDRWRGIAAECFDPTAALFLSELAELAPDLTRRTRAQAFVFSVSAMLSLLTSQGRIGALGAEGTENPGAGRATPGQVDHLVAFCAAGFAVSADGRR